MNEADLLVFARGDGLRIAVAIFVFGMLLRLFEILALGRRADLSPARAGRSGAGWRIVFSRSLPRRVLARSSYATYLLGYVFHLGFFVTLFFYVPHIRLARHLFGLSWPGLPTAVVDAVALTTLLALLAALVHRLYHPVKRFLSGFGDYLAWTLTFLPVASGYLAFHHLLLPYTTLLALHILSVELLLVAMPFTKLAHAVTLFVARWHNGQILGHKGAVL